MTTAMQIRSDIASIDPDSLDTWDFDVFFFTQEQLVAHVCLMFMRLGLTAYQVCPAQPLPLVAVVCADTGQASQPSCVCALKPQ